MSLKRINTLKEIPVWQGKNEKGLDTGIQYTQKRKNWQERIYLLQLMPLDQQRTEANVGFGIVKDAAVGTSQI